MLLLETQKEGLTAACRYKRPCREVGGAAEAALKQPLKTNERQIFHIIPLTLGQLYVIILTCEGLCPPTHFVM